jgi:hypothetical protein
MTEISAAPVENEPASMFSVMHVAIARLQSAKWVSDRLRLPKEGWQVDLT